MRADAERKAAEIAARAEREAREEIGRVRSAARLAGEAERERVLREAQERAAHAAREKEPLLDGAAKAVMEFLLK